MEKPRMGGPTRVGASRATMKAQGMTRLTWAMALGVVLAALVSAPAQWLSWAVSQLTHGQVQMRDARGSVWRGDAQWVLTSGEGGREALALPSRLAWQIQWVGFLSWQWRFQTDCCLTQPWRFTLIPSIDGLDLSLQGGASQWPLRWLGGLGAPWNTVGLDGFLGTKEVDLKVSWRPWHAQGLQIVGKADLEMAEVTSDLSTIKPLGDYKVLLVANENVSISLQTLRGHLNLQGQGTWNTKGLRFEGLAEAAKGYEAALMNVLGVLGQRRGERTVLKWV